MKVVSEKNDGISGEKPERKDVHNPKENKHHKPDSKKNIADDKFSPGEPDDYNAEEFATD